MSKKFFASARKSFTQKLVLYISVIVVAVLVCFGLIAYVLTRMNAETNSMRTMNDTGSLITSIVNDHMTANAVQLESVTKNEMLKDFITEVNVSSDAQSVKNAKGYSEILETLDTICSHNSSIVSAWIVSEQSGILAGNGGNIIDAAQYGLQDKPWYKQYVTGIVPITDSVCTAPAPSIFDADTEVVSIIVPVIENGNAYAFCGIEIPSEEILSILSRYTFNGGSYPIIASDTEIIYTPNSTEFSDKFSDSEITLKNIINQSGAASLGIDTFVSEKSGTVYYYMENSLIKGWKIIVLFDSKEINGNIYKTFMQLVLVLACLFALMLIVIANVLHRENAVLHEIRDCAEEIAQGNCNYRIKNAGKNVLGEIAFSLNRIGKTLQAKNSIISSYDSTDTLTGLSNRVKLYEHMDDLIQTREEGRSRFAVMFIDLDNFRWLNETLGHNFGDAVLVGFGNTLKEQLSSDCTVFRFSGDEFIIIKEFDTDYSFVYDFIRRMQSCFNKPLEIMNDKIYIKFSVGISIYPDDDMTPDLLLRDAEMALHRAKDNGKDRVSFYSNAHKNQSNFSKAAIARCLNEALENGELFLHYQPIVSADSCDIHGFEVLLRWINPEFGVVPPTEFISVAEESGEIVRIGTWIFESACRTLKQINETLNPDIIMSINVSPVQLRRDNYIEHIKSVIDITQVNPKNIQLEITESTLIDFTDSKSNVINQINDLGIALALDDFGTGYSSLNYLKNFPIKCLKIDKSFIDEINNNKRDYAITDSIIDLVHNLGIKTVAEGIETVGQYDFLSKMKCDYIQGFLMSKPLEEADAIEFVEKYDALHKPDKQKLEETERRLADERREKLRRQEEEKQQDSEGKDVTFTEDIVISK